MNKIKVIKVNTTKNKIEVKEIENNLESFYKELNCNTIDIIHRKIGNKTFDIICDDEGLFKEKQITSLITYCDNYIVEIIINNIIITNNDSENQTSLTKEDINLILKNTTKIKDTKVIVAKI